MVKAAAPAVNRERREMGLFGSGIVQESYPLAAPVSMGGRSLGDCWRSDPVCRGLSRSGDCRIADATIDAVQGTGAQTPRSCAFGPGAAGDGKGVSAPRNIPLRTSPAVPHY